MKLSRIPGFALVTRVLPLLLAAALLMPAVGLAQQSARKGHSAAARVQRLEDTEEIRNLLIDYGRDLDAHDLAAYSHLFARDGEWVGGFGSAKGPAAIQALMEKNLGVTARGKPGSTYHLLTNFRIDVHGDTATAWSRWNFVARVLKITPRSCTAATTTTRSSAKTVLGNSSVASRSTISRSPLRLKRSKANDTARFCALVLELSIARYGTASAALPLLLCVPTG